MTDPHPKQVLASVEQVLADLERRRPLFENLCKELSAHIEKCLHDDQIAFQTVQWRVKSADKAEAKYRAPHKANRYQGLDDLTDIAALRIITYYEDEVDVIKAILEREFQIDWENCQDKRVPENPELFTYSALHLVVFLKPETLGTRAHKKFDGVRAEIQITTSLRHAWAEIEHKWYDLWDAFPVKAKRRFARLSALIEIADQEFVNLRKEFEAGNESTGLLVGGDEETPINTQSLRAFIEQEPLVGEIDSEIAVVVGRDLNGELTDTIIDFTSKLLKKSGLASLRNLRDSLQLHRSEIVNTASKLTAASIHRGVCIFHLALTISTIGDFDAME